MDKEGNYNKNNAIARVLSGDCGKSGQIDGIFCISSHQPEALEKQPYFEGFPSPMTTCLNCENEFERRSSRGRRIDCCSDNCRRERIKKQKAEWHAANRNSSDPRQNIACQTCQTSFEAPPAKVGRVQRFCSDECRRKSIRAAKSRLIERRRPRLTNPAGDV